jgi:2-keto-4-pentenoate hydratase
MAFEKEIETLAEAEKSRQPVAPISEKRAAALTLDEAHTICEQRLQQRMASGERLVGMKVAFTNIPVREQMGMPDSAYGYITDRMVLQSGVQLEMDTLIAPRLECEICFRLAKDLSGKGLTVDQVLAATDGLSAAFEIVDSRFGEGRCPYHDFFADNGSAARVVLSGSWRPVKEVDLLCERVVLTKDGQKVAEGRGDAVMGHPAEAVAWLAAMLAKRKRHLKAGQFVMTGTLTPITPIERGATYKAAFSSVGEVIMRTT